MSLDREVSEGSVAVLIRGLRIWVRARSGLVDVFVDPAMWPALGQK